MKPHRPKALNGLVASSSGHPILVLTLPGAERLPSRYKAALPLRLAARPSLVSDS